MKSQFNVLTLLFGLSVLIIQSCKEKPDSNLLKKVLANIDQIRSASYFSTVSASAPGDTAKFNSYNWYKKEY